MGEIINVVSRNKHMDKIEIYNRTIKECMRAGYNTLPYKHVPPTLIIKLMYSQVFWWNMFALKGSISLTQTPSEIILNQNLDFNVHCKVEFGKYVQSHEEYDNSVADRTVGAIAT